jgi:hypothetical protein
MDDSLEGVYSFPGRVVQERTSDAALLEMARTQRAYDPSVFEEHAPAFFAVEISSDRVDAYFTHMLPTSLRNYAEDAAAGISVLTGHNHSSIPFGRSLTGTYQDGRKTGVKRVLSDFYTMRDLVLNGQPTNDLIDAMRGSLIEDASIGFHGGKMLCNICGRDMLRSWDCWHIPGLRYDKSKPDAHDPVEGGMLCLGEIDGAHLSEYSMVYEGATPGAGLIKARAEVSRGHVTPERTAHLERIYRMRMPDVPRTFAGSQTVTIGAGGELSMPEETQSVTIEGGQAARDAIVRGLRGAGLTLPGTDPATNESLVAFVTRSLAEKDADIARLKPLADDGATARGDLVGQALAAGGRAIGEKDWKREEWKERLERWTLADIVAQRDTWASMGDKIFGPGRQTVSTEPLAPLPAQENTHRLWTADELAKLARA